ncbi:MAG: fibronectin type III domain-containing protein [Anaerolineaceae bacterium]|nr:fibronectin type III domain-containing protein [Anaerolineaceae bacterium]
MAVRRRFVRVAPWWLALFLLSLTATPLTADDCDQYDDVGFTFLEVSDTGLITFDDLGEGYTYEVMACEIGEGEALGCDFETEYYTVSTNSYQIADWDAEKTYWYGVTGMTPDDCFIAGRARDYNYTEPVAEEEDVIPTATALPVLSPPDNIAFAPGGTTVTWDAVTDAAGYIIEWFKGTDSPTSHEVTGTSYSIPNFDTTESYAVTVKTVNGANVAGPASDNVVWTPPGAPKNLRINDDGSVTWDPVEEADQYKVGWNQQGGTQSQAQTFTIQSTTNMQDIPVVQPEYDIPDFDPGSDYSANVRTVTEAGAESARSFTTRDVPPSPDGLKISEFGVVTWNAVTEATHYLVNWRKADEAWNEDNQVTTERFTIPAFDAVEDYIVTLRTVNNQDIESYPPVAEAWRPPTARAPSQLKITSVGFVSWSGPSNADRYHANWRLKDGTWSSDIEVDAADPLNFTISGFDDTLEYEVRVKTEVDVGNTSVESGYSTQTWPMPVMENWHSGESSDERASDDDEWNWRIAPHNGASLIVWFRDGLLEARSGEQGTSLFTGARCTTFTNHLITSSSTLEIWCTASNHYLVVELNPQHPADNRRDLLYFDFSVSDCYRSYEYLATGEQEVWLRLCRE